MKERKVGDKVWLARFHNHAEVERICPVCFGKKVVTLILGNDERVELGCEYCSVGYNPPTGYIKDYERVVESEQLTITRVDKSKDARGETIEYHSNHWILHEENTFDTKEEADARAQELLDEYLEEENTRTEHLKENAKKSFSWNAGYHMREAKSHEKKALYHREKAKLCKERSKED